MLYLINIISLALCLGSDAKQTSLRSEENIEQTTGNDQPLTLNGLLHFIKTDDYKIFLHENIQGYETRNAYCKTDHGKHWFWDDGPACKNCVKACPPDTNTDECNIHCSPYWNELKLNETFSATKKELQGQKQRVNNIERIAKTSIVISVLGLSVGVCYICVMSSWFSKKFKRMALMFQPKLQEASMDKDAETVPMQPTQPEEV